MERIKPCWTGKIVLNFFLLNIHDNNYVQIHLFSVELKQNETKQHKIALSPNKNYESFLIYVRQRYHAPKH